MPDHVLAGLVGLAALGVALAIVVRRWWTAPVVDAVERLRSDLADRADVAHLTARIESDLSRKDRRP